MARKLLCWLGRHEMKITRAFGLSAEAECIHCSQKKIGCFTSEGFIWIKEPRHD